MFRVVRVAVQDKRSASTDFGWRAHTAMEAWLARADLKASILLALQGVAAILVVTSRDVVLGSRWQWPALVGATALGLLALAICVTAGATLPILGSTRSHRAEHLKHMIYFGHLRLWQATALGAQLPRVGLREETAMLANQLVFVAKINWRKHRLLQLSVLLTIIVIVLLTIAALGAQFGMAHGAPPVATR